MAANQGSAGVYARKDILVIHADAIMKDWKDSNGQWRGLSVADFETFSERLLLENENDTLGRSVRSALQRSRLIGRSDALLSPEPIATFNKVLATQFGRSTSSLYSFMRHASVTWLAGEVVMTPSRHLRASGFEGFSGVHKAGREEVRVQFDASDETLGAALRECISRCL